MSNKIVFNIGDTIKDNKRNMYITDKYIIQKTVNNKGRQIKRNEIIYKFKCNQCGWKDGIISHSSLLNNVRCSCCTNQVVVEGINDIPTTAPWMIKYFQGGYDEAKKYTCQSHKKINPLCPHCGRIGRETYIYNIYKTKTVSCPCKDGWSYPNKFVYKFLEQLNLEFLPEQSFNWSNGKLYDDYVIHNGKHIIIENHGMFHYEKKREQVNDEYKYNLAIEHNIDYYITLDCRFSELDWIKNSIMNSILPTLFNFKECDINWSECDKFATSNLVKIICEYKNTHSQLFTSDISKIFKLSKVTIKKYLVKGTKLGWCEYEPDKELVRAAKCYNRNRRDKPILCIDLNKVFRNSNKCADYIRNCDNMKYDANNIRKVCDGQRPKYKSHSFQYITKQEFNTIKSQSPELAFGDYFILPEESAQQ